MVSCNTPAPPVKMSNHHHHVGANVLFIHDNFKKKWAPASPLGCFDADRPNKRRHRCHKTDSTSVYQMAPQNFALATRNVKKPSRERACLARL